MIYVDEKVKDGSYILNLQFASFENDASPSKPILFKIEEIWISISEFQQS